MSIHDRMNSHIPWIPVAEARPEPGEEVYMVFETDTIDPDLYPAVRLATIEVVADDPTRRRWKLLDFDPETEEEYLLHSNTVRMWRYRSLS